MREDHGGDYSARTMDLERALLAFVVRIHRTSDCGVGGAHEPECDALFEQLGWENYEEYVVAKADELEQDAQQAK